MATNKSNNRLLLLRPKITTIFFIVLFFETLLHRSAALPMPDSEALLKLKRSFTITKALDTWVPGLPPCNNATQWRGILCIKGVVTGLSLQSLGLSGTIDVTALRSIRGLRIISLSNNSFSGPIPDLTSLVALRAIYLSANKFSGEISSEYFAKMTFLKKLWLDNNLLGGHVPSSLSRLPRLIELRLENNRFAGPVPPLFAATASGSLVSLNLSGNQFSGEVPDSLLAKFGPAVFLGNPGVCGPDLAKDCMSNAAVESKKVVAAAITSGAVILTVAVLLIVRHSKRRVAAAAGGGSSHGAGHPSVEVHVGNLNKKEIDSAKRAGSINNLALKGRGGSGSGSGSSGSGSGSGSGNDIVMVREEKGAFGMPDLMKATAEVLGGSAMGSSYKAVMANGVAVVVKRIKDMNVGGKDRFDVEIRRLGSIAHTNVLSPLAYHFRKEEKLVVSEYVPGGSLLYLLHGERGSSRSELNWSSRLRIIQGIAKGLSHIHKELSTLDLPHGNLKSSNILLGPDYEPLLSDYGFAHLITPISASTSLFACTAEPGTTVSAQSDVFCLGIVILEIMTGRFPSQYLGGTGKLGGTDVVRLAAGNTGSEVFDPEIAGERGSMGQMRRLIRLGSACADSDPGRRPTAAEALATIEDIAADEADNGRGNGGGNGGARVQDMPSLRNGFAEQISAVERPVFDDVVVEEDEIDRRRPGLKSGSSFAF